MQMSSTGWKGVMYRRYEPTVTALFALELMEKSWK